MNTAEATYEEIEEAILHLPVTDRSRLATRILESLEDDGSEVSSRWREELERRAGDIDAGKATLLPAQTVWKRINERYGTSF